MYARIMDGPLLHNYFLCLLFPTVTEKADPYDDISFARRTFDRDHDLPLFRDPEDEVVEHTLTQIQECYLFRLPPRVRAQGWL